MGSIYKRSDGYLYYCYTKNNRRKYVSLGRATKRLMREKKRIKEELDKKYEEQSILPYWEKIKFSDFVNDFKKKKDRQKTKDYYDYVAKKFIEKAGDLYIDEITPFDVDMIKKAPELSVNSKNTIIRGIKSILNEAVRLELRSPINIENVKGKKVEREIITEKEIEVLLDSLKNEKYRLVVRFMLASGFRKNEVVKLRWEDIDWEKNVIRLEETKTKKKDLFPLLDEIKDLLWPIAESEGLVFGFKNADSMNHLKRHLSKHHMTFQDFRRYFATKWSKKLTPSELQMLMRHSSFKTTSQYYIYLQLDEVSRKMKEAERSLK